VRCYYWGLLFGTLVTTLLTEVPVSKECFAGSGHCYKFSGATVLYLIVYIVGTLLLFILCKKLLRYKHSFVDYSKIIPGKNDGVAQYLAQGYSLEESYNRAICYLSEILGVEMITHEGVHESVLIPLGFARFGDLIVRRKDIYLILFVQIMPLRL
jgi:hypothetical protein